MVLEFLNDLYKKNLSYSALNTARSSISSVIYCDGFPVGQHPLVIRFMKGVFKLRPNLPKYNRIWDPKIVLKLLGNWSPNSELELQKTKKGIFLLSKTPLKPQNQASILNL